MKLFQLKSKPDVVLPDDPRKFFISMPTARLNKFFNKEKKIQKWAFRIFLIAIGLWFFIACMIGIGKGVQYKNTYKADPTVLGIIPWNFILIGVIFALWQTFLCPLLHLLNTGQTVLMNFGGQSVMYSILKDGQIAKIVGIFAACGALVFICAFAVRGIKISMARNVEEQEGFKQNTALAIFASVLGLFTMTFAFFLVTSIVCYIGSWLITTMLGVNSSQIGLLVWNYGCNVWTIEHWSFVPWMWPGETGFTSFFSVFTLTILAISAGAFLFKFLIAVFGSVLKIAVLYISSFIALGKWSQDEGGSFDGHKNDLISCMLNYLIAFALFQFFMIMVNLIGTGVEATVPAGAKVFGIHTVAAIVVFAAGAVSLTELQKRLPEIYQMNRNTAGLMRAEDTTQQGKRTTSRTTNQMERQGEMGGRDLVKNSGKSGSAGAKGATGAAGKGLRGAAGKGAKGATGAAGKAAGGAGQVVASAGKAVTKVARPTVVK